MLVLHRDRQRLERVAFRRPRDQFVSLIGVHMLKLIVQLPVIALFFFSTGFCVAEEPVLNEAVRLIRAGSLEEGALRINTIIESNPLHAGNWNTIDGSKPVDEKALAHGREQFQQLAKDRPEILRGGKHFEALHAWAIREFAGASLGFLVDWDNSMRPAFQADAAAAEHDAPYHGRNAKIRIAATVIDDRGTSRSIEFEELWHHLVFEFYNLRGTGAFNKLDDHASRGKLSRVDYVEKIFHLEHEAIQITHRFYALKFLPCASAAGMQSNPHYWYVTHPGWWRRSEELINAFPFHSYPWKVYGDQYDSLNPSGSYAVVREQEWARSNAAGHGD